MTIRAYRLFDRNVESSMIASWKTSIMMEERTLKKLSAVGVQSRLTELQMLLRDLENMDCYSHTAIQRDLKSKS